MCALTINEITELMWGGLALIQELFDYADNIDYFPSKQLSLLMCV